MNGQSMYLKLSHGRNDSYADMHGQGFDGAIIGPLLASKMMYASFIHIKFDTIEQAIKQFPNAVDVWVTVPVVDDCIKYDNKFYGEWEFYLK
jgi:hypothetical protein